MSTPTTIYPRMPSGPDPREKIWTARTSPEKIRPLPLYVPGHEPGPTSKLGHEPGPVGKSLARWTSAARAWMNKRP